MSQLRGLQDAFQAYLCTQHEAILPAIVARDASDAECRMSIYANAYVARLIDALATTYPHLLAYVGSEEFTQLARDYLQQYPSTFRSIRWFGDKLPQFLQTSHALSAENPILVELAKVEWTMTLVFDAADEQSLTLEDFQALPVAHWESLRVQFHSSCHSLSLSWNTIEIWQALEAERIPPEPLQAERQSWMLWRRGLENQYCLLAEDDAWALETLQSGATFAVLCEGLCQWHAVDAVPMKAVSLLKGWIIEGLIHSLKC